MSGVLSGTVWELDVLFAVLCVPLLLLAWRRGHLTFVLGCVVVGLHVEFASIWLGNTHCHAVSAWTLRVCSSANSIAFYPLALYVATLCAPMLVASWAVPSAAALVLLLFAIPYEAQGPLLGWWVYPLGNMVGGGALVARFHGMPIMAAFFHPAMGWAAALAAWFCGCSFNAPHASRTRVVLALVLLCPLALLVGQTIAGLELLGAHKTTGVPAAIAVLFALPCVLARDAPTPAHAGSRVDGVLLVFIALVWHAYMLSRRFADASRGASIPNDLLLLCAASAVCSTLLVAKAAVRMATAPVHSKSKSH